VCENSQHRPDELPIDDELSWLLEKARQGDELVLPRLRDRLDNCPELWSRYGDLAAHARAEWVRTISGKDVALRESTTRKVEELKRELAGPEPGAIERLLAERAVICWLQLCHADIMALGALSQSPQAAEFWSKRESGAHRRYLQSLAALATLRRLLRDESRGPQPETGNRDASRAISKAS
jgi:hypothetical protein